MDPKKVTITVNRMQRRGFIPPRRLADAEAEEGERDPGQRSFVGLRKENGGYRKKRNLSPMFGRLIKALERRCNQSGENVDTQVDEGNKESYDAAEKNIAPLEHNEQVTAETKAFKYESSERSKSQFAEKRSVPQRLEDSGQSSQKHLSSSQPGFSTQTQDCNDKVFYEAVYAKASARKHKKMESDGFIVVSKGVNIVLKDTSGKTIESCSNYKLDSEHIEDGKIFKLGGKEVQISEQIFSNPFATDVTVPMPDSTAINKLGKLPQPCTSKPFISPCPPGMHSATAKMNKTKSEPLFDPTTPDALVMPVLDSTEDVKVVVDPHLSRNLREHQRDGVTFLYKCVMDKNYSGAILGDEMGLGKTLQCITLLWTLIKQGPYQRKPVVRRALIVAPSSLVSNWDKEFHRWLGYERLRVFAVNSDHPLKHCPPQCPVIIMSYEMATRSEDALQKMRFDIIVCDEAHKIKNRNGQAYVFLSKLSCKRRILLTGTPVQNDLMELHALVDFANPGVLGTENEFRKEYERPIAKYQEPRSTLYEKQMGQTAALQLNNILNNFFLRRTHNVMVRYLPPRVTYVVMCKLSKLQVGLYEQLLSLNIVQDCVTGSGNCTAPLSVILALRKLCNHPTLLHPKSNSITKEEESIYKTMGKHFPQGFRHDLLRIEDSGKMKVLASLLKNLHGQKVVVVSHYTQTLDLLENLCRMLNFTFKRLDGSTLSTQRQQIVDQFNNGVNERIFLLSSKAGGLGLNLQGASNIILYDIDWNPAHDIQAMSRCWRPGQKKITHIYRLITSGTIEERIYQRQIAKQDLSGSVMDLLLSNASVKFSPQDLKDIFSLVTGKTCLTHDLIECPCACDGNNKDLNRSLEWANVDDDDSDTENVPLKPPPRKKLRAISTMAELNSWEHHGPSFENLNEQGITNAACDVQFVFCSRSLQQDDDVK